jgi:hypothetical protein
MNYFIVKRFFNLLIILLIFLSPFQILSGQQKKKGEINLALTGDIPANQFSNYNTGVRLSVRINVQKPNDMMNRDDANPVFSTELTPNPDLETFVKRSITDYLERIGIKINSSGKLLNVIVQQFEINYLSGNGWTGTAKLTFILLGNNQEELFKQSPRGFNKLNGTADNYSEAAFVINEAYFEALKLVDWGKLAFTAAQGDVQNNLAQTPKNTQTNQTLTNQAVQNQVKNSPETEVIKSAVSLSDIDMNIPLTYQKNENTFAVIIGNEDYDNEIKVKFAKNDARTFNEYTIKTLGVPKENVRFIENATFGKMLGEIDWLRDVAKAYQGKAKLIFYYAGHGMPDESSKSAYLLPIDGDASTTRTAIKVEELYSALSEYPVQQATVFLDACFSGAARDGMLASGRGVRIMPKANAPKGNLVIFTAVSGDETAHPYNDKQHGLFSYYLMKKLQESKGDINYQELSKYISTNVNQHSVVSGRAQNPTVNVSTAVQDSWGNWRLK